MELRTSGLSLAKLGAEITDRNGSILAQTEISGDFGGTSVLTLNQTTPDGKYYLQVHAGSDAFWATGDYSITIATPSRLQVDANKIAEWTRNAHRWYYNSDRTKDGFSYQLLPASNQGPETNDRHTDDTIARSVDMPMALSTASRTIHQIVGTISDLVDVDHYRVVAPKLLNGNDELVIDLESLHVDGLVPQIRLFDKDARVLNPEVRVQGFGQTQLVLANVHAEQEFIIELKADSVNDEFKTGSFSLTATFSEPSSKPELLISGNVVAGAGSVEREWYVARPQLFGFSIEGTTSLPSMEGQVWVSVFDEQRRLVSGLVAPLNSLRSAPGLFLNPGTYYLQVAAVSNTTTSADVSFRLMVDRPSRPIGPVLGGTNVQPLFLCPGSTTDYCYPNNPNPTVTTQQVGPSPINPLPAPSNRPVTPNPSSWYWSNNFLPTNPTNALDVTGNGQVEPLDVLVIINAINSIGVGPIPALPVFLGHLDTNANGMVDPLDVLIVINFLNR